MKTQVAQKQWPILATLARYRQLASSKIIDNMRGNQCLLCLQPAQSRCLCSGCLGDLPWQERVCERCALPMPATSAAKQCFDCQSAPPRWQSAQAVFHYQFPIDRLIAAFKYHHQLALTDLFAELMAAKLPPLPEHALIVPVPLHPDRLRERGYDQTYLLARAISRRSGLACNATSLKRTRDTAMQKNLHRDDRLSNLQGAFSCSGQRLCHRPIVLVDDVMTTGATLSVISDALLNQGAESVHTLVIARTLPA